jgi:prolipoprotein diacylglyceryltransferase
VAGYAVGRFFIEFVRNNQVVALGLTGQQFFSAGLLLVVAGYFALTQLRKQSTQFV